MDDLEPTPAQIAASKKSAWAELTAQFPNGDKSQFFDQVYSDGKGNITGSEMFFKGGSSVFGSDRKYWSQQMEAALGLEGVEGFPYQLSPLRIKKALPIPAVDFPKAAPNLKKIFNNPINLYVRPDSFFVVKLREIFQNTRIRHNSAAEAKRWLEGPRMDYWPQQLNFAVFCVYCILLHLVYCILGAQVNVRSSIIGAGGRAKEAQTEFLTLMEDAIRQPDLAKSVQRYQLAVDEAKVRLNLAVCPGAWLMPARMIINTESTVRYNNTLKQAIPGMKLGVNNGLNSGTKKAGIRLMEGGPSKINPPNNHPSNPIHKAAQEATNDLPSEKEKTPQQEIKEKTPQHEINKTAVIVGMVAVVALLLR